MTKGKVILALCAALLLFYGSCVYQVYSFSKQYYDTKTDVAIVLGAGISQGELSPIFRERMNHAINLHKLDSVDFILITGGLSEGELISDSKAASNYAVAQGIDSNYILLEEESTITYYNIANAKAILEKNKLINALIVSDAYHLKRSLKMCDKLGIEALPSPTPTSMFKSKKVKRKFLLKEGFFYALFLMFGQFR